ncbi:TPA: hypothetical protein UMV35_000492 [Stenotrophomonas maltophilia]|uniref:hypothetical protein n=1 Tax=Stenotrophomonas TaxID=40323 RepID=UPI001953457A|nr:MULTISPECIES: hypothetical protein [Stenotrophomonas]MDH2023067.1 hypothetical protein [Stenotrophomonas sp. GD03680]HDS1558857.1 hypothetical protein [Stenotrophomonas maltophilia]HEL3748248.1 hypothetical protein [Stenotrophomonas maltophilia]
MVGLRGNPPDGNATIAHPMCTWRFEQDQLRPPTADGKLHLPPRRVDGRHPMQDRKPARWTAPRIILWSLIAAFVLFYGGYHLGKDLALRDNARQAAGR